MLIDLLTKRTSNGSEYFDMMLHHFSNSRNSSIKYSSASPLKRKCELIFYVSRAVVLTLPYNFPTITP